jgi:transcription elongation GreA/GreB family factor
MDSPLGRVVLGKGIGSDIVVPTPEGETSYEIIGVRYRHESSK